MAEAADKDELKERQHKSHNAIDFSVLFSADLELCFFPGLLDILLDKESVRGVGAGFQHLVK